MEKNLIDMPIVDIMLDIECTGVKPGCHVIAIGACTFGRIGDMGSILFNDAASYHGDDRFEADPETLDWWSKQPSWKYDAAFSGVQPVDKMLEKFAVYLKQFPSKRVWGNSASFDLKILEHAYITCGLPVPWGFRDEMCYRTLKKLFPEVPYRPTANSHVAIEDAWAQAVHAEEIFGYLDGLKGTYAAVAADQQLDGESQS